MLFSREPATHHDVIAQQVAKYDELIGSGQYRPFIYPSGTYGAALVIAYLLIDHRSRPWLRRCRYIVWAWIVAFSTWCVINTRARNPATSFGVGLISAWATLWCAVMLVFNDAQTDFQRIERKERWMDEQSDDEEPSTASNSTQTETHANGNGLRKRAPNSSNGDVGNKERPAQRKGTLAWQSYPTSPFLERLDWVCDVFCNFRGMGWNWRLSSLPPPPKHVQAQLHQNNDTPISSSSTHINRSGIHRYHTRSSLLRENAYLLIRGYFILDLLKTLVVHDPYFWNGSYSRPPGYLPLFLKASPVAVKAARLLISLAAVHTALQTIFAMGPLFFVGVLGPRVLGARGEVWMYPDSFGSFRVVLDKGLAGWWGGWWHQTFRHAFESAGSTATAYLGWEKKSVKAKMLQLVVAFALSGCLHACGSYTQLGDTRPLRGPFLFFVLQVFGIAGQMAWLAGLKKAGLKDKVPVWMAWLGNFAYTHVWFYYTAPLLCDDFAKGGIWLFEPVPISLFRGLGLGAKGDGWFMWYGGLFWWHKGSSWFDTGLAL